MRTRDDLHDYQRDAVQFLLDRPKSALFADVGMGKSAISGTVLSEVLHDLNSGQALIVAPIRVAKQTWPTELAEWSHMTWIDHTLIRAEDADEDVKAVFDKYRQRFLSAATVLGVPVAARNRLAASFAGTYREQYKQEKRRRLANAKTPLHVIGLPQVEWLVQHHGKRWPYKTVIIDEASCFKDFQTKRWRAINSVYKYIDRMHLLTASPAAETWMSLWAIIGLLDRGERLGRRITHYRERYFDYSAYEYSYTLKHNAQEQISKEISDVCLVLKAEDHLSLEQPNYIDRTIELGDEVIALYDNFVQTMILSLPEAEIESVSGGVLINKLLQFTGGAVLDEDRRVHEVHDEKLDECAEIIDELQGEPVIIAYWYNSSKARLRKRFPHATVMDKSGNAVDKWNRGEIPILLLHPASAGHGINLQHGGHDMIFFDIPWSRELWEQCVGRLARQGQKKVVRVYRLLVRRKRPPGYERWGKRQKEDHMTADEIVMQALAEKGEGQAALFRYIRQMRDKARAKADDVQAGATVLARTTTGDDL